MSNGRIVAWEAREWAYNHVVRNNYSPTIDEIQEITNPTNDPKAIILNAINIPSGSIGTIASKNTIKHPNKIPYV